MEEKGPWKWLKMKEEQSPLIYSSVLKLRWSCGEGDALPQTRIPKPGVHLIKNATKLKSLQHL